MGVSDDVSLREYVERLIDSFERHHSELHAELALAVEHADDATRERVSAALASLDKRLDAMNEFRKSLEDFSNKAVSRDVFDIVTNRVTIVENTYLRRDDYNKDLDATRDRYQEDLEARDKRIAALERTTVRSETLDAQRSELDRTRKALVYSVIGGTVLIVINIILNLVQSKP